MSRNDAEAAAVDGLVQQEICFNFRHIKPSQLRSRSPFFRGKIRSPTATNRYDRRIRSPPSNSSLQRIPLCAPPSSLLSRNQHTLQHRPHRLRNPPLTLRRGMNQIRLIHPRITRHSLEQKRQQHRTVRLRHLAERRRKGLHIVLPHTAGHLHAGHHDFHRRIRRARLRHDGRQIFLHLRDRQTA